MQVAANLIDGFSDGVWFIELAPLTSGDYIPSTVAQALGLTLAPEGDPVENLVRALKGKQTLLVFDNCEHLVEPAARVISAILRGCSESQGPRFEPPRAGNRRRGDLPGAVARRPGEMQASSASDALRYAAIALFAERALPRQPICVDRRERAGRRRHLPAARRHSAGDRAGRRAGEDAQPKTAARTARRAVPRAHRRRSQRTAAPSDACARSIDWSYDLLDERERVLFRRLGIFVNGFTLEGAVAVGSGEDLDELDVFDVLASLVDKSLCSPNRRATRCATGCSNRRAPMPRRSSTTRASAICVAGRHLRYLRDRFAELWERHERTARACRS